MSIDSSIRPKMYWVLQFAGTMVEMRFWCRIRCALVVLCFPNTYSNSNERVGVWTKTQIFCRPYFGLKNRFAKWSIVICPIKSDVRWKSFIEVRAWRKIFKSMLTNMASPGHSVLRYMQSCSNIYVTICHERHIDVIVPAAHSASTY